MPNLTRNERITKLGRAIRRYRGEYRPSEQVTGKPVKWLTPPDPSAYDDIFKWMTSLGYTLQDITAAMVKIDAFKNHEEFGEFMKGIK